MSNEEKPFTTEKMLAAMEPQLKKLTALLETINKKK